MDNLKLLNNVRKIDGIELNMNKHTEDIKETSLKMLIWPNWISKDALQ